MSNLRYLSLDQLVIAREDCLKYIEILRSKPEKHGNIGGQIERLKWIDYYIKECKFKLELKKLYNELSTGQEPLGEEFEKVWNDNIDDLYEE